MAQAEAAPSPASAADLVDMLTGSIEYLTGPDRIMTTARPVLFVEASHASALRKASSRGRSAMVSWIITTLARLGARAPQNGAESIMVCCERLILHRIARQDDSDPRPALDVVVTAALHRAAGAYPASWATAS